MEYIERTLERVIRAVSVDYACLLLIGPRQVGKTTVMEHLMAGSLRSKVSLDDVEMRSLARRDPAFFLELHPAPVLIDEVQYAPELFSCLKLKIDSGAMPGSYWLTGSQSFQLMELARETLAGRTAILHLSGLSQAELYGQASTDPFSLDLEELGVRRTKLQSCSAAELYARIWQGSMPGHRSGRYKDRNIFYSSYVQTYIDRDVSDLIPGIDKLLFADFVRAAACRTAQMLNAHELAADVGISADTARRWLQVLEKSEIIFLLRPYANNLLKRTVKTPKLYFFDTGLVAYLTRYSTPEILMHGALNGAILENYVVSELRKTWLNNGQDCVMHYYRDKDGKEIDLIIEADGELHPLEIKKTTRPGTELVGRFGALDKGTVPRGAGAVLCLTETLSAVDRQNLVVPIWMI